MNGRDDGQREWLVDDFAYELPAHLIAQEPLADRSSSRLMVVRPGSDAFPETTVADIGTLLDPGDLLVANDSRVIPARLFARRAGSGGRVELLLLRRDERGSWVALARPVRRLSPGDRLDVPPKDGAEGPSAVLEISAIRDGGAVDIVFVFPEEPDLETYGATPLPPYITAPLADSSRYQTVYASRDGSAAAPTAGLHFTPALIDAIRRRGVGWATVTLHVGLDTFRPVTVERVADHAIHREWCEVSDETAALVRDTKGRGGRVIAVGTTAARTLESLGRFWEAGGEGGFRGNTDIFITPGYRWRVVDGLVTNFHLPRSTLLMMVSALASVPTIRWAYAAAIERGYRFYSFGDAMLILPGGETR